MPSWPAKDPDAVLDYEYRIPLDAGDSVVSAEPWITKLSGSVNIDTQTLASAPDTVGGVYGQAVTVWLSGGVNGETCVFRVAWATALTRQDDDIITLSVIESDVVPLVLTGYAKPAPAHLLMRYPAFSAVPAATIQYWLTDAERSVDTSWAEGDYAAGLMALAAHNMAMAGLGSESATIATLPAGVTNLRSGSLSVSMTPEAANALVTGGPAATRYGQEYALLLKRNHAGPLVQDTGAWPQADFYGAGYPFGYPV